jgi:hypothetical protein
MNIAFIKRETSWVNVLDAAKTTSGRKDSSSEPSSKWKRKILLAEHSPIRELIYRWKWIDLEYYVSVHFVRHKIGIEHYVRSQRSDKTGVPRSKISQEAFVEHECIANAQAIINISRKRLCCKASMSTVIAWEKVLRGIKDIDPELYSACVRECVYRGFCSEFDSCGYVKTPIFPDVIKDYRK